MDSGSLAASSGVVVSHSDIMDDQLQHRSPDKVPYDTYWKRNYCGVYSAYQKNGRVIAFRHGENKNERRGSFTYNNTIMPPNTTYLSHEYSGYDAAGSYSDYWYYYFGIISLSWCTDSQLSSANSLMKNDLGPVIWPDNGFVNLLGKPNIPGTRHPAVFVDGDYVYVYYISNGVRAARAKLGSDGLPGSFYKLNNGKFSQPALPEGFNKNNRAFLSKGSGPSSTVFSGNNPCSFRVAKLKGTPYYLGVEEEILKDQSQVVYLRVSADLIHWSEPVAIPGASAQTWDKGVLHYPMLYNLDFQNGESIDPAGFYVVGTGIQNGQYRNMCLRLSIAVS